MKCQSAKEKGRTEGEKKGSHSEARHLHLLNPPLACTRLPTETDPQGRERTVVERPDDPTGPAETDVMQEVVERRRIVSTRQKGQVVSNEREDVQRKKGEKGECCEGRSSGRSRERLTGRMVACRRKRGAQRVGMRKRREERVDGGDLARAGRADPVGGAREAADISVLSETGTRGRGRGGRVTGSSSLLVWRSRGAPSAGLDGWRRRWRRGGRVRVGLDLPENLRRSWSWLRRMDGGRDRCKSSREGDGRRRLGEEKSSCPGGGMADRWTRRERRTWEELDRLLLLMVLLLSVAA